MVFAEKKCTRSSDAKPRQARRVAACPRCHAGRAGWPAALRRCTHGLGGLEMSTSTPPILVLVSTSKPAAGLVRAVFSPAAVRQAVRGGRDLYSGGQMHKQPSTRNPTLRPQGVQFLPSLGPE
ncbi:unnamed protein product [Prorocentrum cordatum]|uniref:Uncharacterized protein n=1 Tax=Prorocentrum cordatum TaxID=2364126 RepID=A0ABN9SXQ8_9DINO|nr:unnamed protein product [Polarella glacialis]